eukprot:2040451-Prymnesium_polylepis.1
MLEGSERPQCAGVGSGAIARGGRGGMSEGGRGRAPCGRTAPSSDLEHRELRAVNRAEELAVIGIAAQLALHAKGTGE